MSSRHTRPSWADQGQSRPAAQPSYWRRLLFGRPAARRPRSRALGALLLTDAAVVAALLVALREVSLWLWLSCAAVLVVATVSASWHIRRDERLPAAVCLCAVVGILVGVFPTSSVPEKYRSLVDNARIVVGVVLALAVEVMAIGVPFLRRREEARTAGKPPPTA